MLYLGLYRSLWKKKHCKLTGFCFSEYDTMRVYDFSLRPGRYRGNCLNNVAKTCQRIFRVENCKDWLQFEIGISECRVLCFVIQDVDI